MFSAYGECLNIERINPHVMLFPISAWFPVSLIIRTFRDLHIGGPNQEVRMYEYLGLRDIKGTY